VLNGELDPSFVVSHTLPLEQAPHGYEIFQQKRQLHQGCTQTINRSLLIANLIIQKPLAINHSHFKNNVMKAVCWHGSNDAGGYGTRSKLQPARCNCQNYVNSDLRFLHLYDGYIPTMEKATSLGMSSWERSSKSVVLSKCKDRRSRCRSFCLAYGFFLPKGFIVC